MLCNLTLRTFRGAPVKKKHPVSISERVNYFSRQGLEMMSHSKEIQRRCSKALAIFAKENDGAHKFNEERQIVHLYSYVGRNV